jgi:putative ABC transport system substrate-binding protein
MRAAWSRGIHQRLALVAAALGGAGVLGAAAIGESRVLVLVSHNAAPYEQALAGLQQSLRQQRVDAVVDVVPLAGDAGKAVRALQEAKRSRTRAVVALGTLALEAATQPGVDVPVVAGLVLNASDLRRAPHVTGVTLEFPVEVQLQWLRRFFPTARAVGVLYNPAENRQRVAAAARVADGVGLRLEAQEVGTPRELPAALESLGNRVDVLWGLVDSIVLTPETAKQILLFSFRNRIPVVGPSATWARAGALYALEWDYQDLGAQCAEILVRVLQGASPSALPVSAPRRALHVVNQRAVAHMRRDIPEALIREARELY